MIRFTLYNANVYSAVSTVHVQKQFTLRMYYIIKRLQSEGQTYAYDWSLRFRFIYNPTTKFYDPKPHFIITVALKELL